MASFRLLEHTADVGIEARAATAEELLHQAALAFYHLLGLPAGEEGAREVRTIALSAGDREELLVAWLSEILFLVQTEGFVAGELQFDILDPTRLQARLEGTISKCTPVREIKAITYHNLQVTEEPSGWLARVYLDL